MRTRIKLSELKRMIREDMMKPFPTNTKMLRREIIDAIGILTGISVGTRNRDGYIMHNGDFLSERQQNYIDQVIKFFENLEFKLR
jgi:hypothetical protein